MSIHKLKDPHAVKLALDEFDQLGRTAFLEKYGFGRSREYMLRDPVTGNLYDSKAIVGAAYGYAFPDKGPLGADSFSGGEATVERVLSDLDFEVVRVGQEWSRAEVEATVRDYFEMLSLEAQRISYNKSEHNARLRSHLKIRSKAAIELKHQNISAVLYQLDLPYIPGYKPRTNLQELLRQVVLEFVSSSESQISRVLDNLEAKTEPGDQLFKGVLVAPPIVEVLQPTTKKARLPRKYDYAARDERNRKLGYSGEAWVVRFEQDRLENEERPDLATKIDWLSDRLGDGTGYDILSFESSELARFIEVKTTNGGPLTPFIVSRNEKDFSDETGDAFCLYRVFDFSAAPKLFILRGGLSSNLLLEPMDYRARLKAIRS
ncbi:protein NO VEIN domain-containing protein [Cupriavidus necator]